MLQKIDNLILPTFDLTAYQLQTERGWTAPKIIYLSLLFDNAANLALAAIAFFSDIWIWAFAMTLFVLMAGRQLSEFKELRADMAAGWNEQLTKKYAFMADHWRTKFISMRAMMLLTTLMFLIFLGHPAADGENLLVAAIGLFTLGKLVRGYARCVLPEPPTVTRYVAKATTGPA